MWIEGNQKKIPKKKVNQELAKAEGHLEEKDAKIWLEKFFRENIQFTVDTLMGIELLPFQSMMIKTMMKSDYFLAILGRGSSKCEKWDNLIWTDKGLKRMIDVEVGDYVQSLKGRNLVLDKTINESDTTYQLRTAHGFVSTGLDYHRVLRLNPETLNFDWTFSKDIQIGDHLVCRKGDNFWQPQKDIFQGFSFQVKTNSHNTKDINFKGASIEDWYYFFGLLIGDGHIHAPGVQIQSEDESVILFLNKFFSAIGLSPRIAKRDGNKSVAIICNSVQLVAFLSFVGFDFSLAHQKTIPQNLLCCSKESAKMILRGLFDTDGYCSHFKNTKKNSTKIVVGFTSTSEKLCSQVRNLLLNFNITSSTRISFKGGLSKFPNGQTCQCKAAQSVYINDFLNLQIFSENIGFGIERKQSKLSLLCDYQYIDGEFSNAIPFVGDFLKRKYGRKSFTSNLTKLSTGEFRYLNKYSFRKNTSTKWIKKVIEHEFLTTEDEGLMQNLLDNSVFFSKVIDKQESSNVTVDIQVAEEECYVSDGIVSHNTFSCGIFLALFALLNQGVHIGVISASFRQSKGIMKKIIDISKTQKAKFLSDCITRISLQNDEWNIEIGQSKITALPLGQGERLRGFRFQVMVIDELLLMPNKIIQEIVVPFLAVVTNPTERKRLKEAEDKLIEQGKMTEAERKVWPSNKLIGLSSASYQFENLYAMYKEYEKAILSGENKNAHYSVFHMSYEAVPKELYDPALLEKAKGEMSEAQMDREFRSIFTSDSSGFFKISKMKACTFEDGQGQCVEVSGDKDFKGILSIDSSWSESESSDYFAMQLLKINENSEEGTLVHPYAIAGGALKDHITYFHYLLTKFNIEFIVADFMGGVQFISAANEHELFKNSKIEIKIIEVDVEDSEKYQDDIREIRQQYNLTDKRICILRKPSTTWIRSGNELLQRSFDTKDLMFAGAAMDGDFVKQTKNTAIIDGLKFIKEEKNMTPSIVDFVENLKDLIDLTKVQCAMIEVNTTPNGHQTFDLPKNLKQQRGISRARKDLYSALVLANWGKKIFFDMKKMPIIEVQNTFAPILI